jgi:nucleotide-binding universal stress UspA family protein
MFRTIVVGTDGSETAASAVDQAGELAKAVGAAVHVVSAYAGAVRPPEEERSDREKVANAALVVAEAAAERLRSSGVREVSVHDYDEDPAEALIATAEEVHADLIVVGNRGVSGVRRFLLGSVAQKVVQHAPCGVLVARTS